MLTYLTVDQIREKFLSFFESKSHPRIASDSLVPQNDPSLLFTGAGMNQFKDNFLGVKKDLKRAASSQKCLRTGDLDQVGKTAFHHSFFEMLGNFSFGDYFKKEAITWAWEFLTEELGIPKDRLRISVHQKDEEAYAIWKNQIGVPENWIYRLGDKGNFWPSNAPKDGPNGPCGPCSEIYFDQGETTGKCTNPQSCTVECECGRFTEIWNLVFTQYNRQDGGILTPLAQKNIDTGMGLERLAGVLQGKKTNFEIDTFREINTAIERTLGVQVPEHARTHLYAISDHVRAIVFSIADGVIPSNEGRGYVIRKLIRRGLWHSKQLVPQGHLQGPFLHQITPTIARVMKNAYPEIEEVALSIATTIRSEEERFLNTLDTGLRILKEKLEGLRKKKNTLIPGEVVFELYDTYGFPEELTRKIAEKEGLSVDTAGFEKAMEEQRKRAKESTQIASEIFTTSELEKIAAGLPATKFLGYETLTANAKVLHTEIKGAQGIVILDQTSFYAESGGQVADCGTLKNDKFQARVTDVQKKDKCFVHSLADIRGVLSVGDMLTADVDTQHRFSIMRNHTATHLLHAVLRSTLGPQVRQLGSLVATDRLRFDYSCATPPTADQLKQIENLVNEEIWANAVVDKAEKSLEQAKQEGATAFFGEKYGEKVRVITVEHFSKELCGGTHCDRTGQIGFFIILSDSSVASGTRRIEAKTGQAALEFVRELRSQMNETCLRLKSTPQEVGARIIKMQETLKKLEKEKVKSATAGLSSKKLAENAIRIGDFRLIAYKDQNLSIDSLRSLSDSLKAETQNTVYFLAAEMDEKIHCVLGMSQDLKNSKMDLRELWKEISKPLQASGGGRKDLIQAGGPNEGQLASQWETLVHAISEFLKKF